MPAAEATSICGAPLELSSSGYRFIRYKDVEGTYLPSPRDRLPPETLCWVLLSKGKKRGRRGRVKPTTVNDNDDNDPELPVDENDDDQRKSLFNRAWVIGTTDDTNINDKTTTTDGAGLTKSHSTNQQQQRVLVRYPKGSTYHVKRNNLVPVLPKKHHSQPLVLVLPETHIYRRWAMMHTHPDDYFWEIGCESGILVDTIRKVSTCPQFVGGMDKSTTSIAQAKERYPECRLLEFSVPLEECENSGNNQQKDVTVNNTNALQAQNDCTGNDESSFQLPPKRQLLPTTLFPTNTENSNDAAAINPSLVVAIDINGNRELIAVQQCVQLVVQEWRPRLIIVKSRALYADLQEHPEQYNAPVPGGCGSGAS